MERFRGLLFVVVTSFSWALISCGEKWEKALKRMDDSSLHNNSPKDWSLVQEIKNEWDINYTIEKIDGDTLKTLFFVEGKDGSTFTSEYWKTYPCEKDTCRLVMASNDTVYFYKEKDGAKTFYVGEYEYRYIHMLFTNDELDFYRLYEDSLKRVKGNDLPRLPILSEQERKKLDSLLNR